MSQEVLQDGSTVAKGAHDEETYEAFQIMIEKENAARSEEFIQASKLETLREKLEQLLSGKTVKEVITILVMALLAQGAFTTSALFFLSVLIKESCTSQENFVRALIAVLASTGVTVLALVVANWIVTHTDEN